MTVSKAPLSLFLVFIKDTRGTMFEFELSQGTLYRSLRVPHSTTPKKTYFSFNYETPFIQFCWICTLSKWIILEMRRNGPCGIILAECGLSGILWYLKLEINVFLSVDANKVLVVVVSKRTKLLWWSFCSERL